MNSIAIESGEHNAGGNVLPSKRLALILLMAAIVPQSVLLMLNWNAWTIARHVVDESNTSPAAYLLAAQLVVLGLNLALAVGLRFGRLRPMMAMAVILMLMHSGLLLLILSSLDRAVPSQLPAWMLNRDNLFFSNIALVMPAAFMSLYMLVKKLMSLVSTGYVVLGSLAGIIGVPVLWYLTATLSQPISLGQFGVILAVLFSTLMIVLFLGGVVAILDLLLNSRLLGDTKGQHFGFVLLLGLIAPLGGLLLNVEFPFPSDFQSHWVYAFTILNAFVLALPVGGQRWAALRLYLRGLVYPFIAYFFLVFLPFLPLSIFAILFMGAGLLMLTPLALGIFQTRITWSEFSVFRGQKSSLSAAVVLGLGLLTLPGVGLLYAKLDQLALHKTLDYFYLPEQNQETLTAREAERGARALLVLRDRKQGLQLPYIAGVYNRIVYQDMVLSDKKIDQLYTWLTGEKLPKFESNQFRFLSPSNRGRWRGWRGEMVSPNRDTHIEHATVSSLSQESSTVTLRLRNNSADTHSMYQTEFSLPSGVFITGMRLKIDDAWVPARIHDKKAALWVFERITERRRDPAIVFYTAPNRVQLRVYPFPANGVREVELKFHYHSRMPVNLKLDGRDLALNDAGAEPVSVRSGQATILNTMGLEAYASEREPYVHFVLPITANNHQASGHWLTHIRSVVDELGISQIAISGANIDISNNPVSILDVTDKEGIQQQIEDSKIPSLDGLWLGNAFSRLIDKHQASEVAASHRPVFVVLAGPNEAMPQLTEVTDWAERLPDTKAWYWHSSQSLQRSTVLATAVNEVLSLRVGEQGLLLPLGATKLLPTSQFEGLQIYEPENGHYIALEQPVETATLTDWPINANLWLEWQAAKVSPAELDRQRARLLSLAQAAGLVLPTTAAIVVENGAQWEVLKRKEKQAMKGHSALDFEDQQQTPEPAEWLMILALIVFLFFRQQRAIKRQVIL